MLYRKCGLTLSLELMKKNKYDSNKDGEGIKAHIKASV